MNTMKKPVLLAVSFGTSYEEAIDKSIGAIENALASAFPNYEVRRAFTSGMIIGKLRERGVYVDTVKESLGRLVDEGVRDVVIQPTHVMPGGEYELVLKDAASFYGRFDSLKTAKPLLYSEEDYEAVTDILLNIAREYDDPDATVVFMGHGTEHSANAGYAKLQRRINSRGYDRLFIGALEAMPSVHYIRALIRLGDYKRVVLHPLMIVAGDHAHNDMAGEGEDSWKNIFESDGMEAECVIKGLGEYADIRRIFVRHSAEAMTE